MVSVVGSLISLVVYLKKLITQKRFTNSNQQRELMMHTFFPFFFHSKQTVPMLFFILLTTVCRLSALRIGASATTSVSESGKVADSVPVCGLWKLLVPVCLRSCCSPLTEKKKSLTAEGKEKPAEAVVQ